MMDMGVSDYEMLYLALVFELFCPFWLISHICPLFLGIICAKGGGIYV